MFKRLCSVLNISSFKNNSNRNQMFAVSPPLSVIENLVEKLGGGKGDGEWI